MQNKYLKFLLFALIVAIAVPQIVLAAWWNPFSWHVWGNIWNGIFHRQTPSSQVGTPSIVSWKTYTNNLYGYEIKYPPNWELREYPDAKTGAGFRPANKPNDPSNEFITVNDFNRASSNCAMPFADYVKIAGPQEVQNFESLNTIEKVSDASVEAYKITWNYTDMQGNKKVSLPITYFKPTGNDCTSPQVMLNNNDYLSTYNQMIVTFKFNGQATPMVGNDRDSHGCIGSAGYSWCEAKQKCLRPWEEKCDAAAANPADKTAACVTSGGTVATQTCYCTGTKDFYNNCAVGACTCPPDPAYARQVKTCSCGEGKCFNGQKCVNLSY